jgi:hypothetical protein
MVVLHMKVSADGGAAHEGKERLLIGCVQMVALRMKVRRGYSQGW